MQAQGCAMKKVVRSIVMDGPERIRELIELGVHFDERENGSGRPELDLTKEGGHSKRRILHSRDVTGREIERALLAAVASETNIEVFENHMAVDLITLGKLGHLSTDRVLGAYVLNEVNGEVLPVRSDHVILATGGCGRGLSLHHESRNSDG
jgi:L-aspartate oxidase